MKTLYVQYHSEAWMKLDRKWITWEVFDYDGIKMAKMIWTDNF